MKTLIRIAPLLFFVLCSSSVRPEKNAAGNTLTGAWGYQNGSVNTVLICTDHVFAVASFDEAAKKLIHSYGGTFRMNQQQWIQTIEWDSQDSTRVGKEVSLPVSFNGKQLSSGKEKWTQLDDGTPGALAGAWIITGNYNNDKVSKRPNPFYPRRTMKILSGKYFHWIAYNLGTRQFVNAGGGMYTTENGKYTERIQFFTKTAESIGKSLVFDYSFVDGDWRHRGQKSTGGPLDECWSKRETLEK
jgi:hypothetical protein